MELELKKECLDTYELGEPQTLTQEETAETIVPDYCPDIARIISAEGVVCLHGGTEQDGVTGTVRVTVLYTPENESGVRALEFAMPFSAQGEGLAGCAHVVVDTEIELLESRMLNPRKIFTRCKLVTHLAGCRKVCLTISSDAETDPALLVEKRCCGQTVSLLRQVAEDITARKDELGFSAFTSAGMDGSSDWRFKTHLANLPIYYEYKADGISSTDAIKGTYLDNYRQIWDLYINNATCEPTLLSTKTGDDAVAEFVTNKAVFYQNGTWAYNDVAELGDDNLGMLPIYIGVDGEEKQGLCTGTENYWCVNAKATLDFMNWCVTSEVGTTAMCGGEGAMPSGQPGMGFVIPFQGNLESSNPLVNIGNQYVADGYEPVSWNFATMPSEEWKNGVGSALTTYAADQTDANWDAVVTAFVDGWAAEAAAVNG